MSLKLADVLRHLSQSLGASAAADLRRDVENLTRAIMDGPSSTSQVSADTVHFLRVNGDLLQALGAGDGLSRLAADLEQSPHIKLAAWRDAVVGTSDVAQKRPGKRKHAKAARMLDEARVQKYVQALKAALEDHQQFALVLERLMRDKTIKSSELAAIATDLAGPTLPKTSMAENYERIRRRQQLTLDADAKRRSILANR